MLMAAHLPAKINFDYFTFTTSKTNHPCKNESEMAFKVNIIEEIQIKHSHSSQL